MLRTRSSSRRKGSILPLMGLLLGVLFGFVALAIDLGLIATARTQCQNAADAAALTGARTLSGDTSTSNNFANCEPGARKAVSANKVLGTTLNGNDTTNVKVDIGAYAYNSSTNAFEEKIPKGSSDPYSLVRVTITSPGNKTFFGSFCGMSQFDTGATATAAHRPRDVALAMDFTGSMRYGSLLGVPRSGARANGSTSGSGSNNPESVYPQFGHYTTTSNAGLQFTSDVMLNSDQFTPGNITEADSADDNKPAVVGDFYQHNAYTDPDIPAFNNTVNGSGPNIPSDASLLTDNLASGDRPLKITLNTGASYAKTFYEVNSNSSTKHAGFESNGYKTFTGTTFNGFTQGPRYWGKTFFIWPPDPTNDWRNKFFGTTDNAKLWDSSGNWLTPTGNYTINYTAILNWIKNTGTNPFPTQMRAGHIKYYGSIPTTIDTSSFPPTDKDQRFWKEYIDHCLGLYQTGSSSWLNVNAYIGYGDDFTWGTLKITAKASVTGGRYMDYQDNPERPRTHFWFGPMTMVDFIGNFNVSRFLMPGTCHEAPLYSCKLGIRGALSDAENNHPNDFMSLILFSFPKSSASDTTNLAGLGRFNAVRVPLGKNYDLMTASLWFPPSTLNADGTNNNTEITPYDTNIDDVPRAAGATCYSIGLMLAYNQFQNTSSSDTVLRKWITPSTSVPEGLAGGLGRKGAQKMIIFTTDGAPNTLATASLQTSGTVKYYKIRYNSANTGGSEYPSTSYIGDNDTSVLTEVYGIIDQIKSDYSTSRRPLRLHTIGFGPVFDSSNPDQATCLSTLQNMQYHGNTQTSASTALDSFKIVTGTDAEMVTKLKAAIAKIMQGSIQIVLLD